MMPSSQTQAPAPAPTAAEAYLPAITRLAGRALSRLDAEPTSPSRGSFDRTWWCWKFTDFPASRFQEGAHLLAWLATSPNAPRCGRGRDRLVDGAAAAIGFWARLQHRDGSFDEAYPFERSLAATAFTGFYLGCALERLRDLLPPRVLDAALAAIERGGGWIAANGEYHGILSNHLAAAAAALQVAGDLIGTDRFVSARDRYLGVIYKEQDPEEGWMREYGGADPGYQGHGMFYLAEIWGRTRGGELGERLARASDFMAWFVHPDGTVGGEYASRGTKFAYPGAFEMLAPQVPSAASIASHLRACISGGRGTGAEQMDAWNLFPLLNNYLFALDAGSELRSPPPLPWAAGEACRVFPNAGLVVASAGGRLLAAGPSMGGALKLWEASGGRLVYEDCGYATRDGGNFAVSQAPSAWEYPPRANGLAITVKAAFRSIPKTRFSPWTFLGFRGFTLTFGRLPLLARLLKDLLVAVLIRRRKPGAARLDRRILLEPDGTLVVEDRLTGLSDDAIPLGRHVPFHMGSSRYADLDDWLGPEIPPPPAQAAAGRGSARRRVCIKVSAGA